jgi:hypothetical protein
VLHTRLDLFRSHVVHGLCRHDSMSVVESSRLLDRVDWRMTMIVSNEAYSNDSHGLSLWSNVDVRLLTILSKWYFCYETSIEPCQVFDNKTDACLCVCLFSMIDLIVFVIYLCDMLIDRRILSVRIDTIRNNSQHWIDVKCARTNPNISQHATDVSFIVRENKYWMLTDVVLFLMLP